MKTSTLVTGAGDETSIVFYSAGGSIFVMSCKCGNTIKGTDSSSHSLSVTLKRIWNKKNPKKKRIRNKIEM